MRQRVDTDRRVVLTLTVLARGVDDVNEFMESLEKTGAFGDLLAHDETLNDEGELEAILEAVYRPAAPASAAAAAAGPSHEPLSQRILREHQSLPLVDRRESACCQRRWPMCWSCSPRGVKAAGAADRAALRRRGAQRAERELARRAGARDGQGPRRRGAERLLPEGAAGRTRRGAPHDGRSLPALAERDRRPLASGGRRKRPSRTTRGSDS